MIVKELWNNFPNFKPTEFSCPCGCEKDIWDMDENLLWVLQTVRNHYKKPVNISKGGGYRCTKYNSTVKGASSTSKHCLKKAADFGISGLCDTEAQRDEIVAFLYTLPNVRYAYHNKDGKYPNMGKVIHVDVK